MVLWQRIRSIHVDSFKILYAGAGLLALAAVLMMSVLTSVIGYKNQAKNDAAGAMPPQTMNTGQVAGERVMEVSSQIVSDGVKSQREVDEAEITVSPITGKVVLDFGWQLNPVYNDWRYHTGMDILANEGQEIKSALSGTVVDVRKDSQLGLTVIVRNKEKNYTLYYGALSSAKVSKNMEVKAGQVIGIAGSSEAEPFTHVHFGVKKDDKYIDPKELF